ncbi:hypothetical protein L484_003529 [Morus notabilis]|uniref:Hexosyltransferase n=2 Tax=Morus notabilis TaxID=981085 RepID=W9SFW7_9ROSA|nr:hypothetical protein L484_003529 [Morus notabilis]
MEDNTAAADVRYISSLDINWDQISDIIKNMLTDKDTYKGIGLLNFNNSEINRWKEVIPDHAEHVALKLDPVSSNTTWESLYPEWIDEEEQFNVPTCPALPKIQVPEKPGIDLVAVKLPCNKRESWSRNVARLHLQLEAARIVANTEENRAVRVLLLTECLPIPNLFTCKDLVVREGNVWLYEPELSRLKDKLQLPIGSCELAVPLKPNENFHSERSAYREAYATILHSAEAYVCGAIAVAQSIRRTGSTRDLLILVDESIGEHHRRGLELAGWKIRTIRRIRNPKAKRGLYNEWNYSKFRLWQLTDYDKIIFLDADLLVLRNIDFLFGFPEISASGNHAALFNSGVMVIEPSNCTFQMLIDQINEIESYNGGDQGFLNEIFTWWHRIPRRMNFLKHLWRIDDEREREMKNRLYRSDPPILYVLHYLGRKPWVCFRDYDCNWNEKYATKFASDDAHETWWKVFDEMPERLRRFCLLSEKQKARLEWDRRRAERANYSDGHWKIQIKDKRLKTCAEDFCLSENVL